MGSEQFRRTATADQRRCGCRPTGQPVYAGPGFDARLYCGVNVIATTPLPVSALVQRLLANGQNEAAKSLVEAYCQQRPDDVQGRFLLALVRRNLADLQGAEAAIGSILGERRAPIQHLAGLIARDQGNEQLAELRFKRALVCSPNHPGAWQALSNLRPLCAAAVAWAAASAIVDPTDSHAWASLAFTVLVSAELPLTHRTRRMLAVALARGCEMMATTAPAVVALTSDEPTVSTDDDTERAFVRLIDQTAGRFRDNPVAISMLNRRLRRCAAHHPNSRSIQLALLALHSRETFPGNLELIRYGQRVVALGSLHPCTSDLKRPFEACVTAKSFAMKPEDETAAITVGHSLGLQALSEQTGLPVTLRWTDGRRRIRLGDREISYQLSSPNVIGFVAKLFLFEPGLWRWMAGFQPDETLLDIGANVGIYTIAAAGLFGARVSALEPYRPNLDTLRRNVSVNRLEDRITVLPIAATDAEQTGRLIHEGGGAGAAAQHFEGGDATDTAESFDTVEGVPVDLLIERGTIAFPNRIKIDVDGNERAVIEGMTRTLGDPRLNSVRLEVRWWFPDGRAVVERVKSFGFRATVDDDPKNLLFTRTAAPAKT